MYVATSPTLRCPAVMPSSYRPAFRIMSVGDVPASPNTMMAQRQNQPIGAFRSERRQTSASAPSRRFGHLPISYASPTVALGCRATYGVSPRKERRLAAGELAPAPQNPHKSGGAGGSHSKPEKRKVAGSTPPLTTQSRNIRWPSHLREQQEERKRHGLARVIFPVL